MRISLIAAALLIALPAWAQAPAPRPSAPRGMPMAPTDSAAPSPRGPAGPGTGTTGATTPAPGGFGGSTSGAGASGTTSAGAPTAGTPSAATSRRRRTLQERFDDANTTHDGKLTVEQARAGHMFAVVRDFAQIDPTNRGYVTLDEIKAQRRAARQARKAARQQQPQQPRR